MVSDRSGAVSDPNEKRRLQDLARRIQRLRRRILAVDILRGALPLRAQTLPARAIRFGAELRERSWRERSAAYAEAMDAVEPLARTTRTVTLDGLKWWVPLTRPDDTAHIERSMQHQGFPYRVMTQTRELAVGGSMIDVGANIGRMSIPRVVLGDVTTAYCAEPDPLNYACLVRNVRDNGLAGLVLPDQLAIGSHDGVVRLTRSKSPGGHRVLDSSTRSKKELKRALEVPCLTLDLWIERMGIDLRDVVFIKVDVQGSEVDVLRGARRALACRYIAWQIEVDLPLLRARGFQGADLFDLLRRHFTHFIDLGRNARGDRLRRIDDIEAALSYVSGGSEGRTDVLVFTLEEPLTSMLRSAAE